MNFCLHSQKYSSFPVLLARLSDFNHYFLIPISHIWAKSPSKENTSINPNHFFRLNLLIFSNG